MKTKFYLHTSMIGLLSICFSIQKVNAQCNCGPGVPATATVYMTSFASTTVYPVIEFPKFDPSIEELRCITFSAVMQGESTSSATATAGADRYRFRLTLTPRFVAPGFDIDSTIDKNYGPDSLASQHWIDSVTLIRPTTVVNSVTYGPTPILVNSSFTANVNGPDPYYTTNLGTPVQFIFSISGGLLTTAGGANYNASVSTLASGDFTLTYYSCPLSALSAKDKKSPALPASSNETDGTQFLSVYPNPVTGGKFSLQFSKPVTGSYRVDVVNSTGQKVYSRTWQLNNTQQVPVDLNSIPSPGLYYLRATDQRTGALRMNKLLVK